MTTSEHFLEAIKEGSLKTVYELLEKQPDLLNAKDEKGVSALLWASYRGHGEITDLLVRKGVNLNIFEAATLGSTEKVQRYLEGDPSLALEFSADGFTALGLASFFGHVEIATLLLKAGADPGLASKNPMRVTPLHSAVANRDAEKALKLTHLLLVNDAKVNVSQEGGWTPLPQAAAHGRLEILRALLNKGADRGARSDDGLLPVDMALKSGHQAEADLLNE